MLFHGNVFPSCSQKQLSFIAQPSSRKSFRKHEARRGHFSTSLSNHRSNEKICSGESFYAHEQHTFNYTCLWFMNPIALIVLNKFLDLNFLSQPEPSQEIGHDRRCRRISRCYLWVCENDIFPLSLAGGEQEEGTLDVRKMKHGSRSHDILFQSASHTRVRAEQGWMCTQQRRTHSTQRAAGRVGRERERKIFCYLPPSFANTTQPNLAEEEGK